MKGVFQVFLPSALIALVCLSLTAQAPYKSSIAASDVAIELPANSGAAALWQTLKKLHTRASLIMITAHPDDEDGGMLTYESRGQGARVALLTLNRGEGGANVMSSDYFDALGLVRTEELLAADRYYGVDQYWTRVVDYGFSKTMDESISKWTRDRVLYDVVRVVRIVRPLVITSVFVGGPSDGHGNHQTAGLMAKEVYRLAGDPTVFPEQIGSGLKPWTPLKDYARAPFSRRGNASPMAVNIEIPEGIYDPPLGLNYLQVSREGLGHQKSQNGGTGIPAAGPMPSAYHRFDSRVAAADKEQSFFDGIDTSLAGIASLAKQGDTAFLVNGLNQINADVERALDQFTAAQPDKVAPFLADGLKGTIALIERLSRSDLSEDAKYDIAHELNIKRAQFNDALAEALGIAVRATVAPATETDPRVAMFMGEPDTFRIAIPGQTFGVKVQIVKVVVDLGFQVGQRRPFAQSIGHCYISRYCCSGRWLHPALLLPSEYRATLLRHPRRTLFEFAALTLSSFGFGGDDVQRGPHRSEPSGANGEARNGFGAGSGATGSGSRYLSCNFSARRYSSSRFEIVPSGCGGS
jgi:LmbE family N-acetylglucosaminyl deacetylase